MTSLDYHWIANLKVLWHLVVSIKKAPYASLAHFLPWNIFANHAYQKRKSVMSPGIVSFAAQIFTNTIHGSFSQEGAAGGILAWFKCSFYVVCLDVFQQLDYMVCECTKGMLHLWSLFTGRLVWTRPVVIEKSYNMYSLLPSRDFNSGWLNSWLEKRKGWQNHGVHFCVYGVLP